MDLYVISVVIQVLLLQFDVCSSGLYSTHASTSESEHTKMVLFSLPQFPGGSHYQSIAAIASGLVENGHEVHLLGNSLSRDNKTISLFNASKLVIYKSEVTDESFSEMLTEVLDEYSSSNMGMHSFGLIPQIIKFSSLDCRGLLSDTTTIARLKSTDYRLLVSDAFFPCDVLLARHLGIPFVAITTSREYPYFRGRILGFPVELSYVPETFFGFTDKMTFLQRVQNVIYRVFFAYLVPLLTLTDYVEIQKDFNIDTDIGILDMMGKAALWLSYTDLSLDYPQPTMPNYVPIGGLALKNAKSLPKELEDFVQGSGDHGVVVFSLGSMIGSLADDHMTSLIASVFSRLPQRVIWRHTGAAPTNLGNNTKILKWIPQNDLLGHPKTRLFIGHGGLNGVYEALYHAVPMILIPLMAPDQWDNAARVVSKGMGLYLDSKTITEESFYEAVVEVLNNQRYQDRVSHYSAILRDLPPAKDRAVFWIEHVLKFGGEHLRAHVFELNLIQYYLIDVAAFFMLIAVAIAVILRFAFRFICRCCRGNKKKID